MTQTTQHDDGPEPQPTRPPKAGARDRQVKIAFLIVVLVAALLIWRTQKRDPSLPGWGGDLPAALQEAKTGNRKVLVFFTDTPMSSNDTHAVRNVITTGRTEEALRKTSWLRVHLSTRQNEAEVRKYGVSATPTYLLLDSNGSELQRRTGLMNDLTFISDFIGAAQTSTAPR